MTPRKVFINLPVRDLEKSMAFFAALGFTFNPQFTDATAACMLLSEEGFVMLITVPRFKDFTKRAIADTGSFTEGIYALSATSRADVDTLFDKAIAMGGQEAMPTVDQGPMYYRSFYDLDGHHWEVIYMDMSAFPAS